MKKILITGGTGLIGMHLSYMLKKKGYQVVHLSRSARKEAVFPAFRWNIDQGYIDPEAFEGVEAVVHLAGAGIADKRWSESRKKIIMDSRVKSTQLLYKFIAELDVRPEVFVSSSAIGFYGSQQAHQLTTESGQGEDFLSKVCQAWESAAQPIKDLGVRTPIIRIGVVFSTRGGALEQLLKSYSFGIGAYFGAGEQYYSWIHIDDLCNWFVKAIEDASMQDIYNGTAPLPATNKEVAAAIASAKKQKVLLLPVPAFVAKLMMGEMSSVVLNSTRVVQKQSDSTIDYQFSDLTQAIQDLLTRKI